MLPRTAQAMYNPIGTAPGFSLLIKKCIFFFLPGVPPEMKRMLSQEVLPRIQKMPGAGQGHCLVRSISTFGLTESVTGDLVADLINDFPEIKLGLRAKFPEIHVKLYLNGTEEYSDAHAGTLSNLPYFIGANNNEGPISYFNGVIDEVLIFNRTLTPEQVINLYNNRTWLIDYN